MNNKIVTVILVLAVGIAAFFGGVKYQQSKPSTGLSPQSGGPRGAGNNRFAQNGVRPVSGEIIAVDANSITVRLTDGSSKIILLAASTSLNKASTATKDDLKTGIRVAAFGTTNSDGSITAQNIQINPMGRMGGGDNASGSAGQPQQY